MVVVKKNLNKSETKTKLTEDIKMLERAMKKINESDFAKEMKIVVKTLKEIACWFEPDGYETEYTRYYEDENGYRYIIDDDGYNICGDADNGDCIYGLG